MEFGSLFNFLFIDSGFVTQIRAYVNGNKKFTFENLNTYAGGLTDKPLWEKLFSDDAVPDPLKESMIPSENTAMMLCMLIILVMSSMMKLAS